ncbi:hypothetical protein FRC00_001289 [Tulasnella sp. 408]|nr:hypothetical protein FRC00_001289 [Tulasnella sp. 408]
MPQATRDYEAQFADLISILDQLSGYEVAWDRVKFRGENAVGSGGFGEVRLATLDNPDSSTVLAVKTLRNHGSKNERARVAVRLAREIRIMAELSHPNIIPLTGFYLDRRDLRKACVIVPYFANGNVGEYLDDNDVDIQKRLEFENILVTDDLHILICDFGISRIMSESNHLTTTSSAKGSPIYMSPELFSGDPRSTLKSDVWAWGCLVLKITSGTGPYPEVRSQQAVAEQLRQGIKPAPVGLIMTEIPYLLHLLDACWQYNPDRRLDMHECVSILSNIFELGDERHRSPALAVLQGLSRYRIEVASIEILERIGQGGYGTVKAARLLQPIQRLQQGADLVAKENSFRDYVEDDFVRSSMRFASEVGLLSQLSHPNIIEFIGFIEDLHHRKAVIITPRAVNGNVRDFLSRRTWGLTHRISLLWDIATAVEYLHTFRPPIIHGDLKSANVVVTQAGHAQLIDFGSSRMIESPDLQEQGMTLRWASPERLNGNVLSLESDIWSLGWTFWEEGCPMKKFAAI